MSYHFYNLYQNFKSLDTILCFQLIQNLNIFTNCYPLMELYTASEEFLNIIYILRYCPKVIYLLQLILTFLIYCVPVYSEEFPSKPSNITKTSALQQIKSHN